VTAAAVWHLWKGSGEEFSWPGFLIALAAIPSMRGLADRKITIAEKIGSRALRADAIEAVTCGWLSVVVVATSRRAMLLRCLVDRWRRLAGDRVALGQGGREAWSGQACDACYLSKFRNGLLQCHHFLLVRVEDVALV
jgi:hypothetical protein